MSELLEAALALVREEVPVFPCRPRSKKPATRNGFLNASIDAALVQGWWDGNPRQNIGVPMGAASGLAALDVDPRDGGEETLGELVGSRELPATLTVATAGPDNGRQYVFRVPRGMQVPSKNLGGGVQLKGEGGYILWPPSLHPVSGKARHFISEEPPADFPAWLLEDAQRRRNGSAAEPITDVISEGDRDTTLASLAGSMRRRGMTATEIRVALEAVNKERCKPPLPAEEISKIAKSIARYEPGKVPKNLEPFALEVLTARALSELPDPPGEDELLGPLCVRGQRLILGGHTGEGKTTAALQIVRAVCKGEGFLDWSGAGDVRALVLDAEQGLKTVKRRLREADLSDSELVDYVRVPEGLELDSDERHVAEVERVLRAGGYALVLADPLYKLHTGDSNAEREAVDLMRRFDAWREELRFALLLPVHCRKPLPGTKFSIHDLFGSSAYVRGAEVVLGLQRVSDGYGKLHFLKDRDGDLPIHTSWGLLFDREQGFRRDPNEGRKPTALDQVRDLLDEDPNLSTAQLVEITGYAERTIRKAVRELSGEEQEG